MRKITVLFFIATLILSVAFNFGIVQGENISESVLRLHIPANSNSLKDQEIKLIIRDKILKKYSPVLGSAAGRVQAEQVITNNLDNIEKDVNLWLKEEGVDYNSKVYLSYSDFPTKNYGELKFPAGNYKALKIVLGKGEGENWWCLMFPPLCFVDGSIKKVDAKEYEQIKKQLGKTAFEIVAHDGTQVFLKFKIVEIVNNIIR